MADLTNICEAVTAWGVLLLFLCDLQVYACLKLAVSDFNDDIQNSTEWRVTLVHKGQSVELNIPMLVNVKNTSSWLLFQVAW
jgi:hypothetical protein